MIPGLDKRISLTRETVDSPNITSRFDEDELGKIGAWVLDGFKADKTSREKWERRMEAAFNLAMQLQQVKSFPWPGASNVKFPLVTIAALQWHSRAYPLLCAGPDVVKMRTNGKDIDGKLQQSATRAARYMSYQLLDESDSWEEETDRALLQLPLIGCVFKKTYFSGDRGGNVSDHVSARDLVINYWAKSVESAERKTHVIPFSRNQVYEKAMVGLWRKGCLEEDWYTGAPQPRSTDDTVGKDRRTGQTPPSQVDDTTPFEFLEQYVHADLDGDGYAEPWIITVERTSGKVVRIAANFEWDQILFLNNKIVRIRPDQVFTKYSFLPSPDGGVYDMGFGLLLGPLNESVDSLINQIIDAGTLATTAGGFLGRGVKIRGGEQSFRPFGWLRVDSTGEDLSKGIYPFPVREPSMVLFKLLSLLVDFTNRISGSTDIMVGENPGQNTPAETSRLMAEQGMKINSAIFKRVWRGMKREFAKLYLLNRRHVPVTVLHYGERSGWVNREDFMHPEGAVCPAADPNLASDTQRTQQAMMIKQQAMVTPGYNKDAVERNLLTAMKVEDIDYIFPGSDKIPAPPPPKVAEAMIKGQIRMQEKAADHKARLEQKIIETLMQQRKTAAEISLIEAQIAQIVAQVGEAQAASQVKAFEAHMGALKDLHDTQQGYLELALGAMSDGGKQGESSGVGGPPSNQGGAQSPAAPNS